MQSPPGDLALRSGFIFEKTEKPRPCFSTPAIWLLDVMAGRSFQPPMFSSSLVSLRHTLSLWKSSTRYLVYLFIYFNATKRLSKTERVNRPLHLRRIRERGGGEYGGGGLTNDPRRSIYRCLYSRCNNRSVAGFVPGPRGQTACISATNQREAGGDIDRRGAPPGLMDSRARWGGGLQTSASSSGQKTGPIQPASTSPSRPLSCQGPGDEDAHHSFFFFFLPILDSPGSPSGSWFAAFRLAEGHSVTKQWKAVRVLDVSGPTAGVRHRGLVTAPVCHGQR